MWKSAMCVVLLTAFASAGAAQQGLQTNASCTFDDGKQISIRYKSAESNERLSDGRIWTPGGAPMLLFTQADLTIGNSEIPAGAYSMFVVPEKNHWTLVVNRNVAEGSAYDEHQDLLRADMQMGQLSEPNKAFRLVFGHLAPKQCNLRIYYGKTGTWLEIQEK